MEKIKVTNGVYWIDVPDADMRILCGCPVDIVKHMMKRGLITDREKDGVAYETGPNAILLSDVSVQNGNFSNLAEFPVLQMLYRQGMIIPDHPNNTGIRPMIIGMRAQVESQSQYIFRGNYGLASQEEIMDAGVPEAQARDMIRLKLKFAFNKIRQTQELVETRVVSKGEVELRNGVFLRRDSFNVYSFTYKGESLTVNLNLSGAQRYETAYKLSNHKIDKEYFSVIHVGEGDGWDVNRPCMASILSFQGKLYLIDAGPNIVHSLTALGISVNEIEGIFHTHAHDDHFAGLTTLVRSDHLIRYYATPLVRASVIKKLSTLMTMDAARFARCFDVRDLEFDVWNNVDGLEVKPVFSPHPVETSIMFFRTLWENGYKQYAHFADTVSLDALEDMITDDETENGVSREFFESVKKSYLVPVDLKKIDVGGGLIHGRADDFVDDDSEKIILSHSALDLTDAQKEIGSSTSFGTEDVLIPAQRDYLMQSAFRYVSSYFGNAPHYELQMLLNFPIITFNPGSILIKKGTINKYMYLTLTGVVEFIDSAMFVNNTLSAGTLAGELSGLIGAKASGTYRAASYVQALRIPCDLYLEFVKRNNLYKDIKQVHNNRQFLVGTWLFGEMLSYPTQNKIARLMKKHAFHEGDPLLTGDERELILLEKGEIQIFSEDEVIETLSDNGFVGEEGVLFNTPGILKVRAVKPSHCYRIPAEAVEDIPNVQWKLFETFERRMRAFGAHYVFSWREEHRINVKELDDQHQKLFNMTHEIREATTHFTGRNVVEEKLGKLIKYMAFHFKCEEGYLERQSYPDLADHKKEHESFMDEMLDFQKKFADGTPFTWSQFLDSLKVWLVDHTINEDRIIGEFLNEKGVF